MSEFAVIEVGSTNTKVYLSRGDEPLDLGSKYIGFKSGYGREGKLREEDVAELVEVIQGVKEKVKEVYVFGTSLFRKISDGKLEGFVSRLKEECGVEFRVVSADEESEYTVKGVISDIEYEGRMAVVIGGGGSTEIAVVEGGEVIRRVNLEFGAMDVTERFPELAEDIAGVEFEEVMEWVRELVGELGEGVDVLVLAGGDYIYFYETVGYEMEKNHLYECGRQSWVLSREKADFYDRDVMERSLDEIKAKCVGNESWWDGARGMRFCMGVVAERLGVKWIVPTRINMLVGLIDEIKKL
ncbi:hypothetical protein FWD07_03345 [Candidatus Saccharibacteria bacterium]|nr:hypothetical protein [Candidatus Saccharibacteria bacterium]